MVNRSVSVVLAAVLISILCTSCGILDHDISPLAVETLRIVIGETRHHALVGMHAKIRNISDRDVSSALFVFSLFDGEDVPIPYEANNVFEATLSLELAGGTASEFIVCLDRYFHYRPKSPVRIRGFRPKSVCFSDGTIWKNEWDAFRFPYDNATEVLE